MACGDVGLRMIKGSPASAQVAESRVRLNRAVRAHFPPFAFYKGLALVAVCFAALAVSNRLSPSARKGRGFAPQAMIASPCTFK